MGVCWKRNHATFFGGGAAAVVGVHGPRARYSAQENTQKRSQRDTPKAAQLESVLSVPPQIFLPLFVYFSCSGVFFFGGE